MKVLTMTLVVIDFSLGPFLIASGSPILGALLIGLGVWNYIALGDL